MTVGKASHGIQNSNDIRECIQERDPTPVESVETALGGSQPWNCTRESTLGRNHTSAASVGKAFARAQISTSTTGSTMGTERVLYVLGSQGRGSCVSFPLLACKSQSIFVTYKQSKWPLGSDGWILNWQGAWKRGWWGLSAQGKEMVDLGVGAKNCSLCRVGSNYWGWIRMSCRWPLVKFFLLLYPLKYDVKG